MSNQDHKYLGDGVYASHDGYQIWLHLGSHESPPLIALEPNVFTSLINYGGTLWDNDALAGVLRKVADRLDNGAGA